MSTKRDQKSLVTRAGNREVVRLVRKIQALTLEVRKLGQHGTKHAEFAVKGARSRSSLVGSRPPRVVLRTRTWESQDDCTRRERERRGGRS
jgi:hypothetical protein